MWLISANWSFQNKILHPDWLLGGLIHPHLNNGPIQSSLSCVLCWLFIYCLHSSPHLRGSSCTYDWSKAPQPMAGSSRHPAYCTVDWSKFNKRPNLIDHPSEDCSTMHSSIFQDYLILEGQPNWQSSKIQTRTNTQNNFIPPGVLSFQVEFVDQFKLMEDIFVLLFWKYKIQPWLVSQRLDLISSKFIYNFFPK